MVAGTFNPSTQETEACGALESKADIGQPGIHTESSVLKTYRNGKRRVILFELELRNMGQFSSEAVEPAALRTRAKGNY